MKGGTRKIPPTKRLSKRPELKIDIDNCLLIGNGLNRCLSEDSISWGDLLKKIAQDLKVDYFENNPMPLEFERIINTHLSQKETDDNLYKFYTKIKFEIAKIMEGSTLPADAIHRCIPRMRHIRLKAIMTTNYDYLLEYAFDHKYRFDKNLDAHIYIPESTHQVDGIEFYHIHGIIGDPKSICLGYDQYMSIVSCLKNAISRKANNLGQSLFIRQILSGARQPTGAWPERFFYSNIAIIGFGLAQCEADIWWLISYRAYLYYTNSWNMKELIRNKIVYYRIIDCTRDKFEHPLTDSWRVEEYELTEEENRLNRLLRSEHVEVNMYALRQGKTYEDVYRKILSDIDRRGIRKYDNDI